MNEDSETILIKQGYRERNLLITVTTRISWNVAFDGKIRVTE